MFGMYKGKEGKGFPYIQKSSGFVVNKDIKIRTQRNE